MKYNKIFIMQNTNLPHVSFVAAFYNKAAYIPDVLAALKVQRGLGEVEYILIDDGSTDSSAQLLKGFASQNENVKLVLQTNQGPASAFNNGIALAIHPYIKLLDGDDILHPDLTNRLVMALEQHHCVAIYARDELHTPFYKLSGNTIYPDNALPNNCPVHTLSIDDHLRMGVGNPSTVLCQTTALKASQGFDKRIFNPDNGLNLRMLAQGQTAVAILPGSIAFPAADATRMSTASGQLVHDDALLLYYFLKDRRVALSYKEQKRNIARQLKRAARYIQTSRTNILWPFAYGLLKLFSFLGSVIALPIQFLKYTAYLTRKNSPPIRISNLS